MELLAFFIKDHFLFGQPEYFNFGGAFIFEFKLKDNVLNIEKAENPKFIKNFYGGNISNISAIVGNNGVGKSSIMRVLNQEPNHEIVSIYIDGQTIIIRSQSEIQISAQFDYKKYDKKNELYPLYYSTHVDYNLKTFHSPISQSNLIDDSIKDYYYNTILRQVFFLNQKAQFLQKNFKDLPFYENLTIKVNQVDKSKFLGSDFYKDATIGKSIKEQLGMLWNHYAVSNEPTIHGDFNFINNFEIFILSLLVSDDTFAKTNSNGYTISFKDVLNEDKFKDKLEVFLKKRLGNIDGALYEILEDSIGVRFENANKLIKKIKENKISKIAGGFDFDQMKNHSILTIIRYLSIWELYDFISSNADKTFIFEKPNEIKISVKQDTSKRFLETFFRLYQDVQESLQYITFEFRLLNIFPEKRLSTGEQSLLNFYSAIYAFARKGENHLRKYNQYLLILDEPETGYHAVWKKKFIKSITEILPELFNELKQSPSIQIIFSTHDALTLSDIPNDNITYLQRLEDSSVKVFKVNEKGRPNRSFGANIIDLLADSFFVDNGLVGDFAKEKINRAIKWINAEALFKEINNRENSLEKFTGNLNKQEIKAKQILLDELRNEVGVYNKEDYESILKIVDEPVLKAKMYSMFENVFSIYVKDQAIKEEIQKLASQIGQDVEFKDKKR
ncbi:AAA family ATPase [Aequorivita sp. CIP111184]|uniref:AAA family ATPase n=1 Tax=Aequorivita sp. CIP111184 TaxID=2211356 RepID=UPI000DBBF577|nr:AAA family ATPase [Aequorivita sp. CIP111184]SRX56127.1 hypothetical protein AEQU1_03154 [Aequorivita sp. CIP111184]